MSEKIILTVGTKVYYNSVFSGLVKGIVTEFYNDNSGQLCYTVKVTSRLINGYLAWEPLHFSASTPDCFPRVAYRKTGMFKFIVLSFEVQA